MAWTVFLLTWGTAAGLRFAGRIGPALDFGDDPDSVGERLPTCITVR